MRAFLDFEASSLAKDGYPIEVAWVFEDGRSESYLIKPLAAWTDWDPGAEAIHGIARQTLLSEGAPAEIVARRVLDALSGHTVYASSPPWDGKWLSLLLRAGGLPRHALRLKDTDEIQLDSVLELIGATAQPDEAKAIAQTLIQHVRESMAGDPVAHRALADAEHERQIWLAVRREAGQHIGPGPDASPLGSA